MRFVIVMIFWSFYFYSLVIMKEKYFFVWVFLSVQMFTCIPHNLSYDAHKKPLEIFCDKP